MTLIVIFHCYYLLMCSMITLYQSYRAWIWFEFRYRVVFPSIAKQSRILQSVLSPDWVVSPSLIWSDYQAMWAYWNKCVTLAISLDQLLSEPQVAHYQVCQKDICQFQLQTSITSSSFPAHSLRICPRTIPLLSSVCYIRLCRSIWFQSWRAQCRPVLNPKSDLAGTQCWTVMILYMRARNSTIIYLAVTQASVFS